ncbi:MAG: protein TolR [Proteobacteria bacterium]|nr:protein TolR [Pseudomonadota bacterium]MBU1686450.1 protein TolR [Pseudomonadota bacterium]
MGFSPHKGHRNLVAEINVTPLVDVMLVLLIIFMITAPMMSQGIDVALPEVTSKPLPQKTTPVIITVNDKGELTMDRIKYKFKGLEQKLTELARQNPESPIFLNADKNVAYGQVVQVMDIIKKAGFDNLGMMTQPLYDKAGQ